MSNHRGEMARAMTPEEIEATVESFAEAALRAKMPGFNGVELHGAHGYLLAQFLSPFTNHRADFYGKDKALFAFQTLDRIRSKVGKDYVVGYRISAYEYVEGGITLPEAQSFARRLEEKGIDYLHVSAGMSETGEHFVTPNYIPPGHLLHLAEGIRKVVRVPVIAVGGLHDPQLAEEALQGNRADLIAMGRALIADPEFPNKLKTGRLEDICPCLRCNEGCSSQLHPGRSLRCSVNAEVGREKQKRIVPETKAKHVCVIGGAAMGCEVAAHLASSGRKVTVVEMLDGLGLDLDPRSRRALVQLLRERKVEILTNWKVDTIQGGSLLLVSSDCRNLEVAVDTVVLATGLTPNQELLGPLMEKFGDVHVIGDCLQPRKIYEAVQEGAFVGRVI
jgi:hypothetical protein